MSEATVIDGAGFAAGLRARVADGVAAFAARAGRAPGLAVVLVGEDPASQVYVRAKGRMTVEAGMVSIEHKLPQTTTQDELLALVRAEALGCNILCGDSTRDRTLKDVAIHRARSMIVSAGRDDTSILITLTARHLAPRLPISIVVRNEDNELPARQAGASTVINPVSFAGLLLAGSTSGRHIADYMADLAASGGRVKLNERAVLPEEIGGPLSAIRTGLGVRIYREDRPFGFWEAEAQRLQTGDCLIEIVNGDAPPEGDRDG